MRSFVLLLLVASCAGIKPVKDFSSERALNAIRVTGEGRGRLNQKASSNVFSFEAVLKDQKDWVLAINVPLRGEEVITFENLKEGGPSTRKFGPHTDDIRSLLRFLLAPALGLERSCQKHECTVGNEKFFLNIEEDRVRIRKNDLEVVALHLTDSFFSRTEFTHKDLHLELFWK